MAKVTASAFNVVRNKIASVVGTPDTNTLNLGYNLSVASASVTIGTKVYSDDLNKVIQDLNLAIEHQTGSPTSLLILPAGKLIEQTDLTPISAGVDTAYTNRTTAGTGQLSVVSSDSYSNGDLWSSIHRYKFRLDWGSNAKFRGWANQGGFIAFGGLLTGGSGSNQNGAWANIFQSIGTLVFGGDSASHVNNTRTGSFPNGGLYNILQNGQVGINASVAFTILAADTNYTTNRYSILITPYGGTDARTATGIEIEHKLQDLHTKTGSGPDTVDGLLGLLCSTYYSFSFSPTATSLGVQEIG